MKKFFTLLAAALVAMSASADYYLIGGFNDWTSADASAKFVAANDGSGNYTLDLTKPLTSGFKINNGSWSDGNNNFGSQNGAKLTPGTTFNLWANGSSGNIEFADENTTVANAHLVFNPTNKTLLVSGASAEATTIYGIHGDIFGVSSWSTENMTESNGKWVLANKTIVAGSFGIKAMNSLTQGQTGWFSADGNATVTVGATMKCKSEGTNFSIAAGTYTFTYDPAALTLVVTGTSTGEVPEPNVWENWWVNLAGDFNGNDFDKTYTQPNKDGIATFENVALGTSTFEIKTWDGSVNSYYNSAASNLPLQTWTSVSNAGYEGAYLYVEGATDDAVYTIQFNCENNEVYVTLVSGGTVTYPATLYVIGQLAIGEWSPTVGAEMTNEGDGIYEIGEVELIGDGQFSFTTSLATTEGDWSGLGQRYGAAVNSGNDVQIAVGETKTLVKDGDPKCFYTSAPGKYKITVSLDDMEVTLDNAAGVEGVVVDANAPVEYFNLQGVRVANPENGLYIVRQGNTVNKVYVK